MRRPGLQVTGLKATLSGEAKAFQASYPAAAFKNVELDDNKQLEVPMFCCPSGAVMLIWSPAALATALGHGTV